jgi:hypothetical protein
MRHKPVMMIEFIEPDCGYIALFLLDRGHDHYSFAGKRA